MKESAFKPWESAKINHKFEKENHYFFKSYKTKLINKDFINLVKCCQLIHFAENTKIEVKNGNIKLNYKRN